MVGDKNGDDTFGWEVSVSSFKRCCACLLGSGVYMLRASSLRVFGCE